MTMSRSHSQHRQAIKKKQPHFFKDKKRKRIRELMKRKYHSKNDAHEAIKIPEGIEFVKDFERRERV